MNKMISTLKGAAKLDELIKNGRLTEEDVKELVPQGLDIKIVQYWFLLKD